MECVSGPKGGGICIHLDTRTAHKAKHMHTYRHGHTHARTWKVTVEGKASISARVCVPPPVCCACARMGGVMCVLECYVYDMLTYV